MLLLILLTQNTNVNRQRDISFMGDTQSVGFLRVFRDEQRCRTATPPWRTRTDVGLGLGAALAGTLLSSAWMTRYFLFRFSLTASNSVGHCDAYAA